MAELLTITDVARRSGVASSALRFYEDRGLIRSERAGSGHRRYPRHVLRRIAFIVFAQRVGLTLDEIGGGVSPLPPHPAPPPAHRGPPSPTPTPPVDQRHAPRAPPPGGLVPALADLDVADRRAHRRARPAAGRADRVHRLRVPLARPLPARQPG